MRAIIVMFHHTKYYLVVIGINANITKCCKYAKCMQKKSDIAESSFLCGFTRLQNSSNLGVASKVETLSTLNLVGLEFFICFRDFSCGVQCELL